MNHFDVYFSNWIVIVFGFWMLFKTFETVLSIWRKILEIRLDRLKKKLGDSATNRNPSRKLHE